MKKISLFFVLLVSFSGLSQTRTQEPLLQKPARSALEMSRARFELLNRYAASTLMFWIFDSISPNAANKAESKAWYNLLLHFYRSKAVSPLVFSSHSRGEDSFFLDGQIRVAKTGSKPLDPIFLNEDVLVHKDALGEDRAISWEQAAAILTHEYGHHLKHFGLDLSHEELDRRGAAVRALVENFSRVFSVGDMPPHILAGIDRPLNFVQIAVPEFLDSIPDAKFLHGQLYFFEDALGVTDLTPHIENDIYCINNNERGITHRPMISGVHLKKFSHQGDRLGLSFGGSVNYMCYVRDSGYGMGSGIAEFFSSDFGLINKGTAEKPLWKLDYAFRAHARPGN